MPLMTTIERMTYGKCKPCDLGKQYALIYLKLKQSWDISEFIRGEVIKTLLAEAEVETEDFDFISFDISGGYIYSHPAYTEEDAMDFPDGCFTRSMLDMSYGFKERHGRDMTYGDYASFMRLLNNLCVTDIL